jgi:putative sterol carrier protein
VPSFATAAWIAALHETAAGDAELREASRGRRLVLQQRLSDGPEGPTGWFFVLDDGEVAVHPGDAPQADASFSTDHETARAIHEGRLSPLAAFLSGSLRVGGNPLVLLEHQQAFGRLGDVFAAVRAARD